MTGVVSQFREAVPCQRNINVLRLAFFHVYFRPSGYRPRFSASPSRVKHRGGRCDLAYHFGVSQGRTYNPKMLTIKNVILSFVIEARTPIG